MKPSWSPLRRRWAILRGIHQRRDTPLFVESFCFALATPLLWRLPLERLEGLVEWLVARRRGRAPASAESVAATVEDMLQAGRPLVRRGCLTRGLTLYYCLRRSGLDVSLDFGMGRVSEGDGFDGHCWLVRDGAPYLERRDPALHYVTLYSFHHRGSASGAPS